MTELSEADLQDIRAAHALLGRILRFHEAAAEHGVADATGYPSEPKAYGGCTIEEKENT